MTAIDLDLLLAAASPGGATCLSSTTDLAPAAGPHASVAPAKFARRGVGGVYAYERRYLDGVAEHAVIIDSKQSQLNRAEAALSQAIGEGHTLLSRLPRIVVTYEADGVRTDYADIGLPHRAFDAHIRAGTIDGTPATQVGSYRAIRDASAADARSLLDTSPISLIFGSWDSSRATRQGRWRSVLVGEIVGFCIDAEPALKGGARTDPVGMRIELGSAALNQLADDQRDELSTSTYKKIKAAATKATSGKRESASMLGLGGIPPTLEALAGVACHRIVRSHVLSFATLRQIRFGADAEGDAACRALLAGLALNALARSDSELALRANCDLVEAGPTRLEVDQRAGQRRELEPLSIATADDLLGAALSHAEDKAGVRWEGVSLNVTGNPAILAGAADEESAEPS